MPEPVHMNRVAVSPEVVQWTRERAHLDIEGLMTRFPKLSQWERGEVLPTFRQLEDFAKATHVPFGFLFLPEPPQVPMPISDFRTLGHAYAGSASPDLLDTIYAMQRRQAWLRETRMECEAALRTGGSPCRDCICSCPNGASSSSPGLASQRLGYPGIVEKKKFNPNGVVSHEDRMFPAGFHDEYATPLGLRTEYGPGPRVAATATLGYGTESHWDSRKKNRSNMHLEPS